MKDKKTERKISSPKNASQENASTANKKRKKILEVNGIDKAFPGVQALSDVSFDLYEGEVHVVLGENGAGKSTLMKVLTGVYTRDAGEILLEGKAIHPKNPKEANELGINIIYQEFNLLPDLTVAENIFIGREYRNIFGIVDEKKTYQQTKKLLDRLELSINPNEKVAHLSVGAQQMVEIAKALSFRSKVLIMDEPTAALTEKEIEELFGVIADLKKKGVGIIYISHRLEEFEYIADRITVMRDARYVDTLEFAETSLEELIKLMVGRSLEEKFPKRKSEVGDILFSVKNLSQGTLLKDISFDVRAGEVFGISGLMGAGRTELAKAIFGVDPIDKGKIVLDGSVLSIRSPKNAIHSGIAYLTEDRKKDGLLLNQTVEDNIMISNMEICSLMGLYNFSVSRETCTKFVRHLGIKTPSIAQHVQDLSGGNQQKVIIAKWLCQKKRLLIMDEPTRGIDVGAKREVYQLINAFVHEGVAVIIISSELPEVIGMSDRIMVMCQGSVATILEKDAFDQEKIMYHATGGV